MGFFDLSGITEKMAKILRRKKVQEKHAKIEDVENELPKEILEKLEKDPDLLDLYYNLEDKNKKVIIEAIKKGKIYDKIGLRRTIRKIMKSGISDDMLIAINYYSIKRHGKEFLELPQPKQESLLHEVMKGISENRLLELYHQLNGEINEEMED